MSPRRAVPEKKTRNNRSQWLWVGALAIVAVLAVAVGADWLMKSQTPGSGLESGGRTAGDANAPITFVEYSDFQ